MADIKISGLNALTGLAEDDEFVAVDKSDTTMAASGTDKRVTFAGLKDATASHGRRYKAGQYYNCNQGTGGDNGAAVTQSFLYLVSFPVGEALTIDRIGCSVTTAGTAGSVVRLGMYAPDADGYPGALVLDAGTVAGDTTGWKEITISQALLAETQYYAGICWQGAAPGQLRSWGIGSAAGITPFGALASDGRQTMLAQSGVTGALPNPVVVNSGGTQAPIIRVRAA